MGPLDYALLPIKKYRVFKGRASRSEYWWFYLFFTLTGILFILPILWFSSLMGEGIKSNQLLPWFSLLIILFGIFLFGLIVPYFSVTVRRLHDAGFSAWWLLLALIPYIGGLVLFVLALLPSKPGDNQYGPNPHDDQGGGSPRLNNTIK